jgi:bifunctional non-homologous end joining protein LigD
MCIVFDVLEHDSLGLLKWSYHQRRDLLDSLNLNGSHWQTSAAFEDGERLFESVKLAGLEGVVAKKLSRPCKPGERLWIKVKNKDSWRFPLEREGAMRSRRG